MPPLASALLGETVPVLLAVLAPEVKWFHDDGSKRLADLHILLLLFA